jgi:2-methylcitrate dehydratase PrpD
MSVTEQLAQFVVDTRWDAIPEAAKRKAAQCILDCVGVTLPGAVDPISVPVTRYLAERLGATGRDVLTAYVVVHVDAPALADPEQPGQSVLEDGARVSAKRPGAWPATPAGW